MGLTFFGTIIVVVGLFVLVGFTRRGRVGSQRIGSRCETFTSPLDAAAVFEVLSRGLPPFRCEDADAGSLQIVLGSNPTFATWGFFYPVEIEALPGGDGSIVRVGINSKLIQWGPLVTRWHLKCLGAIRDAVTAKLPSARVVG